MHLSVFLRSNRAIVILQFLLGIKNIYIYNHDARSCKVVVLRVEHYKRFDLISNFLTHIKNYVQVNKY